MLLIERFPVELVFPLRDEDGGCQAANSVSHVPEPVQILALSNAKRV